MALQCDHHRRRLERRAQYAQAHVGVARAQGGLDVTFEPARATQREPGEWGTARTAVQMYFERERSPVPASAGKQRVKRVEAREERLGLGAIVAVWLDQQPHGSPGRDSVSQTARRHEHADEQHQPGGEEREKAQRRATIGHPSDAGVADGRQQRLLDRVD
jgi:hypothetical protein